MAENIMDVASQQLSEEQISTLVGLSEAKNQEQNNNLETVVGNNNVPNIKFGPRKPYVRETPKIGRNDLCPCGSNIKYKKCCMNK